MSTYRLHQDKTLERPVQICTEYWQGKCYKLAHCLLAMMGEAGYGAWCDEQHFPDGPVDWQKLYAILEDKLNQEQERLALIQQGQARQDWADMKAEDPHT